MARTNRGIIYPTDYSEKADVPKNLQILAESTDKAIDEIEFEGNTGAYNRHTQEIVTESITTEIELDFYRSNYIIDVFVNGYKLDNNKYTIQLINDKYYVVFTNTLDIGAVVEIHIINTSYVENIDDELDEESGNAVGNAVITAQINALISRIEALENQLGT